MTTTDKPRIHKVEDHEGDGRCSYCEREGLRWVALLSDGTRVGLECAKKVTGRPASRTDYAWIQDFDVIAEYVECPDHPSSVLHTLLQRKDGTQTAWAGNGILQQMGGARATWERYGWI